MSDMDCFGAGILLMVFIGYMLVTLATDAVEARADPVVWWLKPGVYLWRAFIVCLFLVSVYSVLHFLFTTVKGWLHV